MWGVPQQYPAGMPPAGMPPPAPANQERGRKLVPTTANATYNLNSILASTITSSDYFLSLLSEYDSFEAVMDVIRDECFHLEAFEPGKAHLPSTAFCCMYKLFMLKLDVQQMNFMLRHKNVYIRGVGLLYLRCIGDPKQLMNWCEPHLEDNTEFAATCNADHKTTVSQWLLSLVCNHKYCGTVLRRVPVPVVRTFERKGLEIEIRRERAERVRHKLVRGLQCRCRWTDGVVYDARIDEVLENGNFYVTYLPYENEEEVAITEFDLDSLPKDTGGGGGGGQSGSSSSKRSSSRDRDRKDKRSRSRDRDRSSKDRDRDRRSRDRDRSSRDRSRDRSRKSKRSRSRSRSRDRKRGSRSRSRDRDRDRRDDRGRDDRGGRNSGPDLSSMTIEEEIEYRLKQKRDSERNTAVSSDGRYCAQIVSYKKSLSKQFKGGATFETTNRKLDLPDAHPRSSYDRSRGRDRRRSPSPEYQAPKKELTYEQKMKKRELLARYGDASNKRR